MMTEMMTETMIETIKMITNIIKMIEIIGIIEKTIEMMIETIEIEELIVKNMTHIKINL